MNQPSKSIIVLHCIPSMNGGGAEKQLCKLVTALKHYQVESHVCLLEKGVNYQALESSGATIHLLKVKSNYSLDICRQINDIIDKIKPDIVEVWLSPMYFFGGISAIKKNIPFIFYERSYPGVDMFTKHALPKLFIAHKSKVILTNSEAAKRIWKKFVFNKQKVMFIPNIVNQKISTNENPRLLPKPYSAVYLGRLNESKNVKILIEAFALVVQSIPQAILKIVGAGPLEKELKQKVINSNLTEHIEFLGYTQNVSETLSNAQLFVSLSIVEGMPNSVLESAFHGTPMILSDIPQHRSIFPENSAIYCKADQAPEAAAAIIYGFQNPEELKLMSVRARNIAQNYSEENVVPQFLQLYNKIVS
ncbi:MAG: glycosyltransferase [Saprospiraceae bacterium]|jgi:glycosyltransferase involved in cell wall biosynthesis|nr:glycosyltransferase [Saprospiraceae bacterium]MBK7794793.1 glycosyltransferase [Saprospiraceae bacterium]MBL0261391.1 glycosyltransferase [Saprospiraceae bacterium]